MSQYFPIALLAGFALGASAFAGEKDQKAVASKPLDDRWQFSLSLPGWIPWLEGDTGVGGNTGHIDLGPSNLIPKIDMIVDVRAEARKERWSVLGEVLYMSLSNGIGTKTAVKKIDIQVDQTFAEFAVAWRLIEGPRGSLDAVGGVRYTNLFQQLVTQPNPERITETSTHLVDTLSDRIARALSGRQIHQRVAAELASVGDTELGRPSTLPAAPLGGRLTQQIRAKIDHLIDASKAELAAAAQARAQAGNSAERAVAQERVDGIKKDLSKKIARTMTSNFDTRIARTDDWWDPYVGLRGRYNVNAKFYMTAKADIGGFGVGSDLTWSAEAALGCQVTERVFSEVGYRALAVDYEGNGLTYDMIIHGPQVTLGITF
jgi:hypothetical protein